MKKSIFDDIHSFEDIQKQRLRLEKKLRDTEKSISEKTDITRLLFKTKKGHSGFDSETDYKTVIIGSVLPLGINLIMKMIRDNLDKKVLRKIIIYSIYGSVSALLVYSYFNYQKTKSDP